MTPEMQKNIKFTQDSAYYAGFGTQYHQAIEEGIREGKKEIPLEQAWKAYGENAIVVWQPKITEHEKRPEFYNFNGFQATLLQEGKEPVTQFMSHYKMTGATTEQSAILLQGGTALVSDWDNKEKAKRHVFAKLDMIQLVKPGENYPVIRINARDLEIGKLYSKEDVVANQEDKEKHLAQLQAGSRIEVKVREYVGQTPRYPTVFLELNIINDKTLGMRVSDAEGTQLREHQILAKQQIGQTIGMFVGNKSQEKLPEGLLRMLEDNKLNGQRNTNLRAFRA